MGDDKADENNKRNHDVDEEEQKNAAKRARTEETTKPTPAAEPSAAAPRDKDVLSANFKERMANRTLIFLEQLSETLGHDVPVEFGDPELMNIVPKIQEPAVKTEPGPSNQPAAHAVQASAREREPPDDPPTPIPSAAVTEEVLKALEDGLNGAADWDSFPDHLGAGTKSRLLSIARLHLLTPMDLVPEGVRALPSNSNRVLLPAPYGCELYQERVTRALAKKMGAKLLIASPHTLRLGDEVGEAEAPEPPSDGFMSFKDPFDGGMSDDEYDPYAPGMLPQEGKFGSAQSVKVKKTPSIGGSAAAASFLVPIARKSEPSSSTSRFLASLPSAARTAAASARDAAAPGSAPGVSGRPQQDGKATTAPATDGQGGGKGVAAADVRFKKGDRVSYIGAQQPPLAFDMPGPPGGARALSAAQAVSDRAQQSIRDLVMMRYRQRGGRGSEGTPTIGAKGRVTDILEEKSGIQKVEVAFDVAFTGGRSLGRDFIDSSGLIVPSPELAHDTEWAEDTYGCAFQALFDVVNEASKRGPLVLLMRGVDRFIKTNNDHIHRLEKYLEALPSCCVVFGAYTTTQSPRKGTPTFSIRAGASNMELLGYDLDALAGRLHGARRQGKASSKLAALARLFPNHLELHAPQSEADQKIWKKMVEKDVAALRETSNRIVIAAALTKCGVVCEEMDQVRVTDQALRRKDVERMVGTAVAEQVAEAHATAPADDAAASAAMTSAPADAEAGCAPMAVDIGEVPAKAQAVTAVGEPGASASRMADGAGPAVQADLEFSGNAETAGLAADAQQALTPGSPRGAKPWKLKAVHLLSAAEHLRCSQAESQPPPEKHGLKDVQPDQYEKQLMGDIVPPEEIAVTFEDIGALDIVKQVLREVVILPLRRPELFTRGTLTKPTKGLLMFGPPGCGKTLLAKAIASESGAKFIAVNMSAITSKWFGEGERLVRALFSLAHKVAPTVIFLDEADALFGKRDKSGEHEASRKMKNEFMAHWDGLRTKQEDRVLVLAATNRPFDIDEAIIRRMPRRLYIGLPDAAQREKILEVILKDECMEPGFSLPDLAAATDGYSGSDLRNLCVAAALVPIRDFLDQEQALDKAPEPDADKAASPTALRPLTMEDMKKAMKQVTPSVASDAVSTTELMRWNEQYGEGGSGKSTVLSYYS